jgi:hypothetical protein
MTPTPLYLLPIDWNPNENEGREARREGLPIDSHRMGESAAAKDFIRGWKSEDLICKVPVRATPLIAPPVAPMVTATRMTTSITPSVAPVQRAVVSGRRGRPPATGNYASREELETAVIAIMGLDPKIISSKVGVSVPTVLKIIEQRRAIASEAVA